MFDFAGWMLLIAGWFSAPLNAEPTVIFVPGWVLNYVSLPEPDFACNLRTTELFADVLGYQFDVSELQDMILADRPQVIRVLVDMNKFPPGQVLATVKKIRAGWDRKTKATIFVQFTRLVDSPQEG